MRRSVGAGVAFLSLLRLGSPAGDVCTYAVSGNTFDLSPLRVDDLQSRSYLLESSADSGGDEYSYMLNICGPVTPVDLPRVCNGYMGAVLQYKLGLMNGACYVAGRYDANDDDDDVSTFSLIDNADPAKGVSLTYESGDNCAKGVVRSTTVEVYCANTEVIMKSAAENSARRCAYRIVMESWYGCPKECGVTSDGLCSSHGSCTTDKATGGSYCLCDNGYSGSSCEISSHNGDLDNDIIASIPYMYSADTEQHRWKGDLLLLIAGMCISLCLGLVYLFVRNRSRRLRGYDELAQVEVVSAENGKEEDESLYFYKGSGAS
jgi:Glucosidase II beta subunit-like protein